MEDETKGWVIVNCNHPNNPTARIFSSSFRRTRKECIAEFVKDSGPNWKYWKTKYNFQCVRATSTITVIDLPNE